MEFELSDKRVIALERLTDEEWSFNGTHVKASLLALSNHEYHVLLKGVSYRVQVESLNAEDKSVSLLVNGKRVALQGKGRYEALLSSLGMDILTSSKAKDLKAPMPGLVIDIAVQQGQQVSAGDNLIILEAMKMENIIKADSPGIIKEIKVSAKDSVEKNQVLITFED